MDNSGHYVKPTKVTLIETCHVQVEAKDFKSMVQSLTGKNSSVAWIGNSPCGASVQQERRPRKPKAPPPQPQWQPQATTTRGGNGGGSACVIVGNDNVVDSSHDMYVNNGVDLDEMLQGLPELENWSWDYVHKYSDP